jgi:hypothetical protein
MFSDIIENWLQKALDWSISEDDFWEMTISELIRAVKAKQNILDRDRRDKAFFDYRLANLIGLSVARIYNKSNHLPSLEEAYPELYDEQERQEKEENAKMQRSILNFKNFAHAYNARFKKEV